MIGARVSRSERGVSLAEVLVALVILAFVGLKVMKLRVPVSLPKVWRAVSLNT
jgi:prepilin-type N-terminal cleavage/methylation domain-containing protein